MKLPDNPKFKACMRRQFTKTAMAGGGTAWLGLLFAASTLAVIATTAYADTWRGTGPFCDGECLAGETPIATSDSGDGAYCITGHKVLCRNNLPTCVPRETRVKCYALVEVCDNGFCEAATGNWHSCDTFACGLCFGSSNSGASIDSCVGSSSDALTVSSTVGSDNQSIKLSIELARFAAIWEKRPKVEWMARHGLTSSQYQQEFTVLTKKGYRLVNISGYGLNGQGYYAAIWEKNSGPAWVAHHGMTSAQYQKEFDELGKQGYRLVDISGYAVSGQDYYAAIWEQKSGPAWVAHHGMTSDQYQKEFDRLSKQGYHIVRVSGWEVTNASHYAAIWERSSNSAQVARHGMTSDQYQKEFDRQIKNGYRLISVSGYGSTEH